MTDPKEPPQPERTIIRPARPPSAPQVPEFGHSAPGFQAAAPPGAAYGAPPGVAPVQPNQAGPAVTFDFAEAEPDLYGPEPLVAAASRLIRLGSQLRTLPVSPELNQLRHLVMRELESFVKRAQSMGLDPRTVQLSHYILCAFIDDSVMTTPWGANSIWSQHSLLAAYHNDVQGGERLFEFAERMEQDPRREPRLMELLYLCLSLGFEGRMALDPRGASLLQQHRHRMHGAIGGMRGNLAPELSPQWRGAKVANTIRAFPVPLWAILAGFAVLALLVFSVMLFRLNTRSDAAIAALSETVGSQQLAPAATPNAPLPGYGQMESILQPDIDAGRLRLLREGNDVVIRLVNQGLFESGTAELASNYRATFGRMAKAANIAGGALRVVGHTDNQPLRTSLVYPSNQALSEARAEEVARGLQEAGIPEDRLTYQGFADTQPIADNASAEGRRENRRVEVRVASNAVWE